jgi:hypothetical protein
LGRRSASNSGRKTRTDPVTPIVAMYSAAMMPTQR